MMARKRFNVLNHKSSRPPTMVLLTGLLMALPNLAVADFLMELRGTPNSSIVAFTLEGSGVASGSFTVPINGVGFQINDDFDPFPASDIGTFTITSGSATWANITTGTVSQASQVLLQDSSFLGLSDRFGIASFSENYTLSEGDVFEWQGTGTFDLSQRGLSFEDLIPGDGVGVFNLPGLPGALDGRITIVSIPEPSAVVVVAGCALLLLRRHR